MAALSLSTVEMYTKFYLQICIHLYGKRRRVALGTVVHSKLAFRLCNVEYKLHRHTDYRRREMRTKAVIVKLARIPNNA